MYATIEGDASETKFFQAWLESLEPAAPVSSWEEEGYAAQDRASR